MEQNTTPETLLNLVNRKKALLIQIKQTTKKTERLQLYTQLRNVFSSMNTVNDVLYREKYKVTWAKNFNYISGQLAGINEIISELNSKKRNVGGSKSKTPQPSANRVVVHGRNRIVYIGPRGGKYIKKDGSFVPI